MLSAVYKNDKRNDYDLRFRWNFWEQCAELKCELSGQCALYLHGKQNSTSSWTNYLTSAHVLNYTIGIYTSGSGVLNGDTYLVTYNSSGRRYVHDF